MTRCNVPKIRLQAIQGNTDYAVSPIRERRGDHACEGLCTTRRKPQLRLNTRRVVGCSLMCSIGIHSEEILFRRRSGRIRRLQVHPPALSAIATRLSVTFLLLSIIFMPVHLMSVTMAMFEYLINRFNCTKVLQGIFLYTGAHKNDGSYLPPHTGPFQRRNYGNAGIIGSVPSMCASG